MNEKVNNFFDKLKRNKLKNNNVLPPSTFDKNFTGRVTEDTLPATELKMIEKPIDLGDGLDDRVSSGKGCTLAYDLDHLLNDSSALSYFIHYLESCDKLHLIKFWMHVEGFKASCQPTEERSRMTAQSLCFLDAKNIFSKYIDEQSTNTIALPRRILSIVQDKMNPESFDPSCFADAQMFVKKLFELRYFPEFMCSVYYKKHELEVLTKRTCSVLDILHIEQLLPAFMELAEEFGDRLLVEMILAVDTWESHFEECADDEVLQDAMAIYDRFFSLQASRGRIQVSDSARTSLEGRICTEGGRPHHKAFTPAKQWAIAHLTKRHLAAFLQSPPFQIYLSELIHTIDSTLELPRANNRQNKSRESIASSSGADSLPVIFSRHFENLSSRKSNMGSSDTTPTGTPRTPRTPKSARLAEIDNMGRYTPLYDTSFNTDLNNTGKFKTRFRKYWDKTTMREEEIAEEVARTIIADIQTMVDSAGSV